MFDFVFAECIKEILYYEKKDVTSYGLVQCVKGYAMWHICVDMQAILVDVSAVGAVFGVQAAAVAGVGNCCWQIGARGRGIVAILWHGSSGIAVAIDARCDQRV